MSRHEYPDPPHAYEHRRSSGARRAAAGLPSRSRQVGASAPEASLPPAGDGSRLVRLLLVAVLVIAVAVPFTLAVSTFWSRSGSDLSVTRMEQDGIAYLRPLVRLIAAASDQQSFDLAGTPGNGDALRVAMRDVDAVDSRLADTLGTRDRWTTARQRLNALIDLPPQPAAAYQAFAQVIDLLQALVTTIGDRSTLILDPDLDSYYLMDATLIRLPSVLVDAGRLSDRGRTSVRGTEVAVLADRLRRESATLDQNMRKSFAATQTSSLAPGLVSAVDSFDDAVTSLVPPTSGLGGVTDTGPRLYANRIRVRDTGLALEEAALTQLNTLMQARADRLNGQRLLVAASAGAGLLLAMLAVWLLLATRANRDTTSGRWPVGSLAAPGGPGPAGEDGGADRGPVAAVTDAGAGAPAFGASAFGAPTSGAPAFGAPAFGASAFGASAFGAPAFGAPAFGAATNAGYPGQDGDPGQDGYPSPAGSPVVSQLPVRRSPR